LPPAVEREFLALLDEESSHYGKMLGPPRQLGRLQQGDRDGFAMFRRLGDALRHKQFDVTDRYRRSHVDVVMGVAEVP
jgi:hypothetical protein